MSQNTTLECYRDYLIAQNNRATATGLAKLMKGHISHKKVSRLRTYRPIQRKV